MQKLKEQIPFTEQIAPAISKFTEHADKITDFSIYAGLAYLSNENGLSPLWGPIALKLAMSNNEVSPVVGLSMLGMLGLHWAGGAFPELYKQKWESLTTCDQKRNYANFLYHRAKIDTKYAPFIEGWYDDGPNYRTCKETEK